MVNQFLCNILAAYLTGDNVWTIYVFSMYLWWNLLEYGLKPRAFLKSLGTVCIIDKQQVDKLIYLYNISLDDLEN